MRQLTLTALALCTVLALIAPNRSFAQAPATGTTAPPESRVSLLAGGGIAAASGDSGGAVGLTAVFSLADRLGFEAAGTSSMVHGGMDSGGAFGSLLLNLMPNGSRTVPYVAAGMGLYRASFDMDGMGFGRFMSRNPGFSGVMPIPGGGFGMMRGTSGTYRPGDPVFDGHAMADFYAQRLGPANAGLDGRFGHRSFTDPALIVGGGAQMRVGPRLVVRPDARAVIAVANGRTRTVGLVTLGFGYVF